MGVERLIKGFWKTKKSGKTEKKCMSINHIPSNTLMTMLTILQVKNWWEVNSSEYEKKYSDHIEHDKKRLHAGVRRDELIHEETEVCMKLWLSFLMYSCRICADHCGR